MTKTQDNIAGLVNYLTAEGFEPVTEHRFHETRRWRFDLALPEHKIAVEQEGGIWIQGRHTRGKGFLGDMEKYNEAAIRGWLVLRFTPEEIRKVIKPAQMVLLAVAGREG